MSSITCKSGALRGTASGLAVAKWAAVAVAIVVAAWLFRNPGMQSVNWTFPYFSGAANFDSLYEWRISPEDYANVKGMPVAEYLSHRHQRSAGTVANIHNNYGYVLVALAARTLLPWMGEGNAVVALQLIVHVGMCLTILALLEGSARRWVFGLLYAVNPVVLHFVTFPFYYFWTGVPCFLLAVVWLRGGRVGAWIVPIALALFFASLVRPTTVFVCLFTLGLALWKGPRVLGAVALGLFLLLQLDAASRFESSPWHTAYIGLGGYDNPYEIRGPFDENGYEYYRQATGRQIDTNPVTGTFTDAGERRLYWDAMRERYRQIAAERPLLLARNALLNTVGAFGFGFDVDRQWLTRLSLLAGLVMIGLIIWCRQWIWGTGVLAYAVAFTPYFPPIPAYLFGAYLFMALAAGGILETLRVKYVLRTGATA